ncbi:uncharacterized protein VICG_01334 [Vittaforma corneae ATCC 50505]|uniref:Uncharacterized protein n=1 Tax=Vittaforma corneae (strain ATCC 50505) TaxID=993615 RepID=L2GL78_VITCO|nr:uncharacterized protein VICG_01334 [Vittaforma corneae ATCC 50505]ELA41586.1 hypothetical protein VICG_01334 [Vittaforma corneae ATCC 50505]
MASEADNSVQSKTSENTKSSKANLDSGKNGGDRILFESLVDNEKEYLKNNLRSSLFEDERTYSYPCSVFCRWLVKQFERIHTHAPSATLLYNLEFLDRKTKAKGLFDCNGSDEKKEAYLSNIIKCKEQKYKDDMDIHALASASKTYIKNHIKFFDAQIVGRLNELYQSDSNRNDRLFFMERLPFIMMNRTVFRLIKGLVLKLDANKKETGMSLDKSIKAWSNAIIPCEVHEEKREAVLKDILNAEFDYVPLGFYD